MPSIADTLMERRKALLTQATDLAQQGVAESRDLTVDEQAKFDKMIAEAEGLHTRATAIAEGEKADQLLNESFRQQTGRELGEESRGESEFGKWAREARVGDSFEVKPTTSETRALYRGATEKRAMSATGGAAADSVYNQLWQYVLSYGQIMQAGVDIINTSDGNTLPLPVATAHASTGTPTVVAANAALTASDATITTVNLSVSKYGYLTLVPTELVQDANFDLEGYIAQAAGRELARTVSAIAAAAAIAGFTTLGYQPAAAGAATSLGTQTTAGQGTDALFSLFHSVLPEYRTNAAWLMADPSIGIIRNLKSTTGGPVWQPAVTAGDPDLIVGKPVYFAPQLPTMAASTKSIYFGEWSALKVRVAGGVRFERSNEYAFGNDQVAFRAVVRCGAVTVDPNAVKFFQNTAT